MQHNPRYYGLSLDGMTTRESIGLLMQSIAQLDKTGLVNHSSNGELTSTVPGEIMSKV